MVGVISPLLPLCSSAPLGSIPFLVARGVSADGDTQGHKQDDQEEAQKEVNPVGNKPEKKVKDIVLFIPIELFLPSEHTFSIAHCSCLEWSLYLPCVVGDSLHSCLTQVRLLGEAVGGDESRGEAILRVERLHLEEEAVAGRRSDGVVLTGSLILNLHHGVDCGV